jgi:hypothetical protein
MFCCTSNLNSRRTSCYQASLKYSNGHQLFVDGLINHAQDLQTGHQVGCFVVIIDGRMSTHMEVVAGDTYR